MRRTWGPLLRYSFVTSARRSKALTRSQTVSSSHLRAITLHKARSDHSTVFPHACSPGCTSAAEVVGSAQPLAQLSDGGDALPKRRGFQGVVHQLANDGWQPIADFTQDLPLNLLLEACPTCPFAGPRRFPEAACPAQGSPCATCSRSGARMSGRWSGTHRRDWDSKRQGLRGGIPQPHRGGLSPSMLLSPNPGFSREGVTNL